MRKMVDRPCLHFSIAVCNWLLWIIRQLKETDHVLRESC